MTQKSDIQTHLSLFAQLPLSDTEVAEQYTVADVLLKLLREHAKGEICFKKILVLGIEDNAIYHLDSFSNSVPDTLALGVVAEQVGKELQRTIIQDDEESQ